MKTPYELAYRYVIPYIQRKLVQALKQRGLSNTEIAKKLGITPSAVTRYLKNERGTTIDLSNHPDVNEYIDELADKIVSKEHISHYEMIAAITVLTAYVLSRRYLCSYHVTIDKDIDPTKCNVCPQLFSAIGKL